MTRRSRNHRSHSRPTARRSSRGTIGRPARWPSLSRALHVELLEPRRMLTDWYVADVPDDPLEDGTLEHPFNQVQEAIDAAANSGDRLLVMPGEYTDDGNRDLDTRGKTLTIQSTAGADVTILDAEGAVPACSRASRAGRSRSAD